MGVVYRAEDTRLGRDVALKFIAVDRLPDDDARRRFDREARAASALNHPNICTVYDVGYDGDVPFLVLELLKGRSLKERLATGPLPLAEMLDIAVSITDALEAAHDAGIVHRDLKPANVFVTDRGIPKLLDFGLAKVTGTPLDAEASTRAASHLTGAHVVVGTLPYMSPEQVRGQPLDARTDLFSFGAVLYEMATGRPPFGGDTSGIVLENVLARTPIEPSRLSANCPPVDLDPKQVQAGRLSLLHLVPEGVPGCDLRRRLRLAERTDNDAAGRGVVANCRRPAERGAAGVHLRRTSDHVALEELGTMEQDVGGEQASQGVTAEGAIRRSAVLTYDDRQHVRGQEF